MSNLEHLFENAINALHRNKTYGEWVLSEVGKNIKAVQGESKAVTFDDNDSTIDLYDIWVLANYVVYTHDQFKED